MSPDLLSNPCSPPPACVCVLSRFCCVRLCATVWTVACQALLSMGFAKARILEWVVMPSSRGSSRPRHRTGVSYVFCIGRQGSLPLAPPGKSQKSCGPLAKTSNSSGLGRAGRRGQERPGAGDTQADSGKTNMSILGKGKEMKGSSRESKPLVQKITRSS